MLRIIRRVVTIQDKNSETTPMSLALFKRELLAKTCWRPRVTQDDSYKSQRPKFAPRPSTITYYNSIHDKITGPDA